MTRVPIHDANAHLSSPLEEVVKGGEVIRDDPSTLARPERKPGRMKGMFDIGPEFFEPMPEDELRLWEGRDDWDFFETPSER